MPKQVLHSSISTLQLVLVVLGTFPAQHSGNKVWVLPWMVYGMHREHERGEQLGCHMLRSGRSRSRHGAALELSSSSGHMLVQAWLKVVQKTAV